MGSKILKAARKLLSMASDLRCDLRAITAVEFALVVPFALLLLFGEYTMCDAISVKRKLMITAHTIADLVARQQSLTASSLSTIVNASAQVIAPYSSAKLSLVISELYTDANGNTTVSWSSALNGTALTQGAKFTLPNGIAQNNTYLIYSSASYTYIPIMGQSIFGNTMNFNSQFYTNPRASTQITLSN